MAARNLLGMRDMPVFLGNAEVAEDISFGPFVFRLSVGENQHAAAVAVQNIYVFPEALRSVGVDMAACIQIKEAVAFLHFLEDMVDGPGFPGPVSESPAGRRQVPAHAAGEFCGKVVFREERDLIKKSSASACLPSRSRAADMRESANERKRFIDPEWEDKAIYREGGDVSNGSSREAFSF